RRLADQRINSWLTTVKVPDFIKAPAVKMLMKWVDKKLEVFKRDFIYHYMEGELQGVSDGLLAEQIANRFVGAIFDVANVCDADALTGDPDVFVIWKPTMAIDVADDGQSLEIERFDDRLWDFFGVSDLKVENDD